MKNRRKKNEYYGKPKRHDFSFSRYFNDWKSGTNEERDLNGKIVRLGTNQLHKLPIRKFIPNKGMNRRERRIKLSKSSKS